MPSRIIKTEAERAEWVRFLSSRPFPMTVSYTKGAARSKQQNRTIHMWFGQISQQTGDEAAEVKAQCKARFGLPIMKRDNPEWVAKYEPLYGPLPYEQKIQLFEILPLTSRLKTHQLAEFMDVMARYYTRQGVSLTDPNDDRGNE